MQLIDAIRSIQKADIKVRVGVAFVLALLIAMTGNLPATFVVSVAGGALLLSIVMLVAWRALRR